ncbi:MAG TPA: FAD-dependent oxidoreductase [Thermotogota bacterium]|nr:FAD-dependent oxidoreductase [Thermotogota bacterium]
MKKIALIGSGTSAIGFLVRLLQQSPKNIIIDCFEQGKALQERIESNDVITGFGGAGTFSDGKLSLSSEIGGDICDLIGISKYEDYIQDVVQLWTRGKKVEKANLTDDKVKRLELDFRQNNLMLRLSDFYHIGTDLLQEVLAEIDEELKEKEDVVHFHFNEFFDFDKIDNYDYTIIASGRYDNKSSHEIQKLLSRLNIDYKENKIDIGIRYEVPSEITDWLTDLLYEFKVLGYSETEELVRTFCVNPKGYVVGEGGNDFSLVNGHSFLNKKSKNTNFAILVTQKFTEPFKDAYVYGSTLALLANKLAGTGKILVQRYGDFVSGRRTTHRRLQKGFLSPTLPKASPGDLNLILPRRIANSIEHFIEQMSNVITGINNPDNLLYGIEAKFYSTKPSFTEPFRLGNENIYLIGDASGYTRGIVQATMSGIYLADILLEKL